MSAHDFYSAPCSARNLPIVPLKDATVWLTAVCSCLYDDDGDVDDGESDGGTYHPSELLMLELEEQQVGHRIESDAEKLWHYLLCVPWLTALLLKLLK